MLPKIGRYFTANAKTRNPEAIMAKVMEISVHFGKYLLPEEASIPVMATFMRLATMPSSVSTEQK